MRASGELVDYEAVAAPEVAALRRALARRATATARRSPASAPRGGEPLERTPASRRSRRSMAARPRRRLAQPGRRSCGTRRAPRWRPSPRSTPTRSPSTPGCNGSPTASSAKRARRALAAGMRIGLYLDFAVGEAPDGSGTWSDREVTVPGVHGSARRPTTSTPPGRTGGSRRSRRWRWRRPGRSRSATLIEDATRHAGALRDRPRDGALAAVPDRRRRHRRRGHLRALPVRGDARGAGARRAAPTAPW